jgi:hypothetical protein
MLNVACCCLHLFITAPTSQVTVRILSTPDHTCHQASPHRSVEVATGPRIPSRKSTIDLGGVLSLSVQPSELVNARPEGHQSLCSTCMISIAKNERFAKPIDGVGSVDGQSRSYCELLARWPRLPDRMECLPTSPVMVGEDRQYVAGMHVQHWNKTSYVLTKFARGCLSEFLYSRDVMTQPKTRLEAPFAPFACNIATDKTTVASARSSFYLHSSILSLPPIGLTCAQHNAPTIHSTTPIPSAMLSDRPSTRCV